MVRTRRREIEGENEADRRCIGTGWKNVEYRTYEFAADDRGDASLVETKQSRDSRRGSEIPLTTEERMNLLETARKAENSDLHSVQAVQAKV